MVTEVGSFSMTNTMGLNLKKTWKSQKTIWFIPRDFSSQQKKLVSKARQQMAGYPSLVWFSSSGSTGKGGIKFFGHTRESLIASALAVNEHLRITSQDRILNPLPVYHVGGFGTWLRAQLAGARWVDCSGLKWSPSKFSETLNKGKITVTSLVPTQVHDLIALDLNPPPQLRAVVVGGGALAPALYHSARALGWPLLPSYGMTEFGSQIATADLESLEEAEYSIENGSAENDEFASVSLPAIDFPTKGSPFKKNPPGLPAVRLLKHIQNIHQDPRGTFIQSEAGCLFQLEITSDGQFSLELKRRSLGILIDDQVDFDPKTRVIKVKGRKTRVVKVKGELVSLDELQSELQSFLKAGSTSEFLITSSPHLREENELVLVVGYQNAFQNNARDGFYTEGDNNGRGTYFFSWLSLIRSFNSKVPPYKSISRVEFMEALPRTELGKVKLSQIRSAFD